MQNGHETGQNKSKFGFGRWDRLEIPFPVDPTDQIQIWTGFDKFRNDVCISYDIWKMTLNEIKLADQKRRAWLGLPAWRLRP